MKKNFTAILPNQVTFDIIEVTGGSYMMGNEAKEEYDQEKPVHEVQLDTSFIGKYLVTQAQWEFASRGGKESRGFLYAGSNEMDEVSWYSENTKENTYPVGEKKPNELRLFDMSGNVWEWCEDWYGNYHIGPSKDPNGSDKGRSRELRGGAIDRHSSRCTVFSRFDYEPNARSSTFGFRLVRIPPSTT